MSVSPGRNDLTVSPAGQPALAAGRPARGATGHVRLAVRLSMVQAMLGSVYMASTGGMFLIGYALSLGADNLQLGLMTTCPMLCVVAQLVGAAIVESGVSRRLVSLGAGLVNVACWGLIILIPYTLWSAGPVVRVGALIAIITLVAAFGHISGNARQSWIGDLIPPRFRGHFFGRTAMYWGIVGTAFAIVEGAFLDWVKSMGIGAFSVLFGFGMLFGTAGTLLFIPQRDMPLGRHPHAHRFWPMVLAALRNWPLMATIGFQVIWLMQSVAWPFYVAYMLRDVGMTYFQMGWVNAAVPVAMVLSSPFWGKVVGGTGCRPVLIACAAVWGLTPCAWAWLDTPTKVMAVMIPMNVVQGLVSGGVNVAINTLIYKVTPAVGRSVQLAVNAIIVVAASAAMPTLGAMLPVWLSAAGVHADLRATFYAAGAFALLAAAGGRFIREDGAKKVRELPAHLWARIRAR